MSPFGAVQRIELDTHVLLPGSTTDALGNTTVTEYDYRVLKPQLVTDPNFNWTVFTYDFGECNAVNVMGKEGMH